jgi:hypothetical protein
MRDMNKALPVLAAFLAAPAFAQDADAVRGGWMADVGGVRHIYMLTVRGTAVTGTYCTDCSDVANLALIQNGVLAAKGLEFEVVNPGPVAYRDFVTAKLVGDGLEVTRGRKGIAAALPTKVVLHRSTSKPAAPPPPPPAGAPPRPAYVPPGPAEPLTPAKVAGLWLFGEGPAKQHFMFKQSGSELFGLACGPCDDPNHMAPLDRVSIDGTTLRYSIVHENNAKAFYDKGPFSNDARASLSQNELHMSVIPSYEPPTSNPIEITMLGPIRGY